jgi:cell division protein FtsW (lipid II flippase)
MVVCFPCARVRVRVDRNVMVYIMFFVSIMFCATPLESVIHSSVRSYKRWIPSGSVLTFPDSNDFKFQMGNGFAVEYLSIPRI